ANVLMTLLERYRLFTGQAVNMSKSAIFFSKNTPQPLQQTICSTLNGITSHRSTRYFGLPLRIGKSKKEVFEYLLHSVRGKLQSWKSKLLSPAGEEVLLKSIAQALPIFTMSCFKFPITL
ncbi:RNA-directed DNA polymerase (reverse transcriptase)-related family protein, partial [Striga hermonthica]